MEFRTCYPKCKKCGKFIGNGDCITARSVNDEEFSQNGPEYFEDLEPYHRKCWNDTFPNRMVKL